jgi:hypothetical protein
VNGGYVDHRLVHLGPHPNGYPDLGLAARTIGLRPRRDANLSNLAQRLNRWEAGRGNPDFRAVHLDELAAPVAFELVHTYIALREWHPEIKPDQVDFAAVCSEDVIAEATMYPMVFPTLRCSDVDVDDPSAREEMRLVDDTTTVHASGRLALGKWVTSIDGQRELAEFWAQRNTVRARTGRPQRLPAIVTAPAAFTLAHEFGHLVDGELCAAGWREAEPVYAALTTTLLGGSTPDPRQWRYHLINYPAWATADLAGGPCTGSVRRAKQTRKALSGRLADVIGSYGPTTRDELFAETFALAHCANVELRARLRPVLRALELTGLRRRRR